MAQDEPVRYSLTDYFGGIGAAKVIEKLEVGDEFKRVTSGAATVADNMMPIMQGTRGWGTNACALRDAATELLIRLDGNEGLFRAYESVEFLHPVYGGDYIEIEARILSVGKSSRKMEFIARKVIENMKPDDPDFKAASSGHVLNPPLVVCKAVGTCVTPIALQKGGP